MNQRRGSFNKAANLLNTKVTKPIKIILVLINSKH
jgi:hypothetical protein